MADIDETQGGNLIAPSRGFKSSALKGRHGPYQFMHAVRRIDRDKDGTDAGARPL